MKKITLLICLSVFFVACSKKESWLIENQKYELKSSLPCDENNCTYVSIVVPTIVSKDSNLSKINDIVFKIIKNHIAFEAGNKEIDSYNELTLSFINSYDELKKAFPNEPLAWEALINGTSHNFNNKCINIVLNYFVFTGGAHGNEGVNSMFFDLESGKQIQQKDIFIDYEGFKKIAEAEFRKINNLSDTDKMNKNGHMFENNQFTLPENIIISENEIILHYNKYEIAPYSSGSSSLKFPFKEYKKYLNPIYF